MRKGVCRGIEVNMEAKLAKGDIFSLLLLGFQPNSNFMDFSYLR